MPDVACLCDQKPLTQYIQRDDLDGLIGRGDLTLIVPRVRHLRLLDPERPPIRSWHVDGLDPAVLGVGQLVKAENVEVADAHPRDLKGFIDINVHSLHMTCKYSQ